MSLIIMMFLFSLAMSISPGPVNMIILSSGVNYGLKKTLPYVSGATIGFTVLLLSIGFVFQKIIEQYPLILTFLAIGGSLYIAYMGYKIACSTPAIEVKQLDTPKFYEGFVLQWLNPKAWIACVSGVSMFSSTTSHIPLVSFICIYFFVCYASLGVWAICGEKLSIHLNSPARLRAFNLIMGFILAITAAYLWYSQLLLVQS